MDGSIAAFEWKPLNSKPNQQPIPAQIPTSVPNFLEQLDAMVEEKMKQEPKKGKNYKLLKK